MVQSLHLSNESNNIFDEYYIALFWVVINYCCFISLYWNFQPSRFLVSYLIFRLSATNALVMACSSCRGQLVLCTLRTLSAGVWWFCLSVLMPLPRARYAAARSACHWRLVLCTLRTLGADCAGVCHPAVWWFCLFGWMLLPLAGCP